MARRTFSENQESSSDVESSIANRHDDLNLNASGLRKRRKLSHDEDEVVSTAMTSNDGLSRIKKAKISASATLLNEAITGSPDTDAVTSSALTVKDFSALDVAPWLVGSLSAMAIQRPTGIQAGCIPEILKGRDCIGGSRTGSGKTVAFAVPILQKWAEDPVGIYAVVLTPTR